MSLSDFPSAPLTKYGIVIGIVSPVGSNTKALTSAIEKFGKQKNFSLNTPHIKLSDIFSVDPSRKQWQGINEKIDKGKEFRKNYGGDILAKYALMRSNRLILVCNLIDLLMEGDIRIANRT